MTDKEKVLRFNFRGSYDDLEPAENGEIMRAFDYDRLAAKLDTANAAADRIDELKTKLAKAVDELENMQKVPRSDASYGILMVMIKYTLAELKGQNDE